MNFRVSGPDKGVLANFETSPSSLQPLLIAALGVILATTAAAQSSRLQLVPKGRPFRLTFADPREIKMALSFEGDSKINAMIGNYFSLFSIQEEGRERFEMHLGLEGAGYFGLTQLDRRFPLESSDGLIGVYLEGRSGQWQWQVRYTHISAHLADGSTDTPIAYSREHLALRGAFVSDEGLHLYGGVYSLLNTIPELAPWTLQWGMNYFWRANLYQLTPFVGSDFKWKTEAEANPSACIQVGLALSDLQETYRSFRFFYSYQTGADPRGQYFMHTATSHSLGVEMQI